MCWKPRGFDPSWPGDERVKTSAALPPVTILCGFLGAGKTTVLQHLLGQSEGARWALVVNDVGAINIDARVVAQRSLDPTFDRPGTRQPVIELGNGCVCCSIKDELAETLAELALTGRSGGPPGEPYDHILVETTGVAEPRGVAQLFLRRNPFGRSLGDLSVLRSLVTVVDASSFLTLWDARVSAHPAGEIVAGREQAPDLFDLMLEQVETADLILVNKCDLISEEQRDAVDAVLEGLNPRAERHAIEQGQIPREIVLERQRFDPRATLSGARWLQNLNAIAPQVDPTQASFVARPAGVAAAPAYESKYGLTSFVYQARRPFSRVRFEETIRRGIPGLVRAKGFCWWQEAPDEMGFLSIAGNRVTIDTLNYWWAALVENGKASLAERPAMICALWEEPHGDRRQELVFIGQNLPEATMRAALDRCLAH